MTERGDIVQELRNVRAYDRDGEPLGIVSLAREAADEIERLRAERNEWQQKWMALAQASLLVGTMRLGDDEQEVR